MSRPDKKTNQHLVDLIGDLKAQSRDTGAAVWRDVALRLSRSRKNWAQPNLSRLTRHAPEGGIVLVPGKLLGSGDVHASHKVAAYSFSASAKDKIVAAGGETLSLHELMKDNPSGKEVFILG